MQPPEMAVTAVTAVTAEMEEMAEMAVDPVLAVSAALHTAQPMDNLAGNGTHLLAEWYECDFSMAALGNAQTLRALCLTATQDCGLHAVGDAFHQFQPHGVTGTVLLAESHLAIHTWPEAGFVTLDVYVCNYLADNTHKALKLYAALKAQFQPGRENLSSVRRGLQDA